MELQPPHPRKKKIQESKHKKMTSYQKIQTKTTNDLYDYFSMAWHS